MNISEQYRVAVVSTGHVKKEDAELLDKVCNDESKSTSMAITRAASAPRPTRYLAQAQSSLGEPPTPPSQVL
ncbi:TPA: hypothetical protein QH636_005475 [Klebsiella pneumoniae subsp. pneumoniae]|nr:hypothetical protein [Klebsiella pneumoniae subsp. pneumoniae]HDS7836902.1 hypothetical protein [Klebsiella pneumoniae subsp. pneumoniae]